ISGVGYRVSGIGSGAALTVEYFGLECVVFAEIDEALRTRVGFGEAFKIGQRALDDADVGTPQKVREALVVAAFSAIAPDNPRDGFRRPPGWNLCRHAAERRSLAVRPAADHDEVLRHRPIAELPDA